MSGSPILPAGGPSSTGLADVVGQDDLTRWAQLAGVLRYFTETPAAPASPSRPIALGASSSKELYENLYAQLIKLGVPSWIAYIWASFWAAIVAVFGPVFLYLVAALSAVVTPAASLLLEALGDLRAGIDPTVGILAQEVLTEFLGVEVGTQNLPLGIGGADHVARAKAIGALLVGQLESELVGPGGAIVPSLQPAATFSGFAVNFGLACGLMGVIGGVLPWPGHLNELRELGEEVATNIGLGRLVRQALRELVRVLVQMPAQWYFNTKYLPTQFRETDLVNPYAQTLLPHDQLYRAMHLLGYSDDKIQAFIEMHQKRLTPTDARLLVNHALWSTDQADKYLAAAGWPQGLQGTLYALEDLREQQKWYDKLLAELEEEVKSGRLTVDEFESILRGTAVTSTIGGASAGGVVLPTLRGLPYSDAVKDVIMATVRYKAAARVKLRAHQLSDGELFYGFAAGILTESELRDRWANLGLPAADQDVRLQLWLLRLNKLEELKKAREQQYQIRIRVFGEKQAGVKHPEPIPPPPPNVPFPLG